MLDAIEAAVEPARRSPSVRNMTVGPRWANREKWHLTLQFLGPVPAQGPVVAATRAVTAVQAPFPFRLGGAGAFPSLWRAKVIWIGAAEGGEPLAGLASAVGAALGPVGYAPEARRFRPHLTVARLRDPVDVRAAVDAIGQEAVGPAWTVTEVVLFASRLSPEGATYSVLERFPLSGPGRGAACR